MSEKHLYEKHLAEKLQQLSPPPDMEGNWQKMKALLEDDSPRGGGYGKRWWRIGVIAGILIIGAWIVGTQFSTTNHADKLVAAQTPNPANVEEKKLLPVKEGAAVNPGKQSGGHAATSAAAPITTGDGSPAAKEPANGLSENSRSLADANSIKSKTDGSTVTASTRNPHTGTTNAVKKYPERNPFAGDIGSSQNTRQKKNNSLKTNYSTQDDLTIHSSTKVKDNNSKTIPVDKPEVTFSPLRENVDYTTSLFLAPSKNLKTDFSVATVTKKTLSSKSLRAARNRLERSFAFGISLPLAFPLGDQKALSYNFNAGANTVSDYLPAPHVQYHFNRKTYLQTELQFVSPQYIRPILLYETRTPQSGYYVYNSIYARKLYYFNVPIGIHHSPFNNFYLGTGLQFSSLLSGVGLYEDTKRNMNGQPMSLLGERYGRLSSDTLSDKLNRAEVRLMLEMNYYYNRFTFGLRYNQAFNNYASFQLNTTTPYTFDKNKALLFYLRYNLWEQKHTSSKGLLSSK